jgi:hypothetical protein
MVVKLGRVMLRVGALGGVGLERERERGAVLEVGGGWEGLCRICLEEGGR